MGSSDTIRRHRANPFRIIEFSNRVSSFSRLVLWPSDELKRIPASLAGIINYHGRRAGESLTDPKVKIASSSKGC